MVVSHLKFSVTMATGTSNQGRGARVKQARVTPLHHCCVCGVIKSPRYIPEVTLCFCIGSYAAAAAAAAATAADRRFLSTGLNNFLDFFHFWHNCWPWPIDYLIRFRSIFVVALTLNFHGQMWNLLYLSQKWSDCHETKSKHIDWTLGLRCDHRVWPWTWPWTWIFQVKYRICYISAKNGPIATKRNANTSTGLEASNVTTRFWPWIFKVKYEICYISTKSGPIAM